MEDSDDVEVQKGDILVVDDHSDMTDLLEVQLKDQGWRVRKASGGIEAVDYLDERVPDVLVTDLKMDDLDGIELLEEGLERDSNLPVIIMTAFGDVESAVDAIKRGAFHFITKPFDYEDLEVFIERAYDTRRLRRENRAFRRMNADNEALARIIGQSDKIRKHKKTIARAATTDAPALVTGESGSGKELAARALHDCSYRSSEPFVPINCAMVPEDLLESELFGHTQGAFTGATSRRDGLFVEADGGSIFLDEIGDMPFKLQAKLLRVIETKQVRPVGSDSARSVDVRIIAATHRDLPRAVEDNEFREDLFYRLNVIPIRVPPLRDRKEDVPLLIEHFIEDAGSRLQEATAETFSDELLRVLKHREWSGNVRELKNVVERLFVFSDNPVVTLEDYEQLFTDEQMADWSFPADSEELVSLDAMSDKYIEWVVDQCGGNKTRAADILEVDPSTIYRRLQD
jgi:two-component system response regulator HydG